MRRASCRRRYSPVCRCSRDRGGGPRSIRTHEPLARRGAGAKFEGCRARDRGWSASDYPIVSVSHSHSLANNRRTPEEQIEITREMKALVDAQATGARPLLIAGLPTAFGCSIEGKIPVADVCRLAVAMKDLGADEINLADTVGYADPHLIKLVVKAVRDAVGDDMPIRLHLHNTLGLGLANVLAGIEAGITRFDAAVGGLGGCPFAPGASGNIATEDLVFMLEQMGLRTGIDFLAP